MHTFCAFYVQPGSWCDTKQVFSEKVKAPPPPHNTQSSWRLLDSQGSFPRADCISSFQICVLRFGKDGFCCCCFHVEKNTRSLLQSKYSGSLCDCSDFFKDLHATYHCFLDCREHNETEVSPGAFIPLLSDLTESSGGHLGHRCQCHFSVCFGFILRGKK